MFLNTPLRQLCIWKFSISQNLGVIALIGGVLNIVMAPSVHTVAACVIPVVYFVCALGLKKNAQ